MSGDGGDVAVAVLVAVLGMVGAIVFKRRGSDEVHSVEGYRSALETLQEVRARSSAATASVRVIGRPDGGAADGVSAMGPSGSQAATDGGSAASAGGNRGGTVRFDDATDGNEPGSELPTLSPRHSRRALSAMNHRPRRIGGPLLAAIIVIAAVTVMAVLLGARGRTSPHKSTTTTTVPATHHNTGGSHHDAPPTHSRTTTSTTPTHSKTPTHYEPNPSTVTGTAATYTPPASSYSFTVKAGSSACWVQITETGPGTTLYAQTLNAGQSESVNLTGTATVDLGSPDSVSMTLDHEPVALPSGYQTPFTLTLQPAAAGA
jgi:hypothetical protein